MRSIYRHEVPVDDQRHTVAMQDGGTDVSIVGVGSRQLGVVEFWAVHEEESPARERTFVVVGTGQPLPSDVKHIWGHAVDGDGFLVWHLVEVA